MAPTLEASVEDFSVKLEPSMSNQAPKEAEVPLTNDKKVTIDGVYMHGNITESQNGTFNGAYFNGAQGRTNSLPASFHIQDIQGLSTPKEYVLPTPPATPFPPFENHFGEVPPPSPNNLRIPQTRSIPNSKRRRSYSTSKPYPRISRPVELLRNEYDVVVIGSGYGGAVAAARFARAGESVCLLERGREKWRKFIISCRHCWIVAHWFLAGEYPTGTTDALRQLHVSGDFAAGSWLGTAVEHGDPTGLYHLIVGEGQNAFVGNGNSPPFLSKLKFVWIVEGRPLSPYPVGFFNSRLNESWD